MLPSMPVLFSRESQNADGFLQLLAPMPGPSRPVPRILQIADKAIAVEHFTVQNGSNTKGKDKETEETSPESEEELNEIRFVTAFYNKVQTKLGSEKFVRFQETLNKFTPNKDSPAELFRKAEALFGEDEELIEEFLLFLTPGQASEVGRFMDHLMLTRISKFIQNLQSTFARKPAKLRQVMRALRGEGARGGGARAGGLRARVEPHLRTSPRLLAHFRALLPDERVPDSLYTEEHTEEFPESAWAADSGEHRIELDEPPARKSALDRHALDVTYLQGRVFLQEGRQLRPALVTFPGSALGPHEHARRLAPAPPPAPPHDSDDDRASPRRKNLKSPKKAPKSPNARNVVKVTKEKKSPERTPKNVEATKKTVKVVIDAQIDAKSVHNVEKTVEPKLNPGDASGPVRNAADNVVRNKRKRETSPDALGVDDKKKSIKVKNLKRLEMKKTDDTNQKAENGNGHVIKTKNAAEKNKTKSVKHKRDVKKNEMTQEAINPHDDTEEKTLADAAFLKPDIPKPHPKRPELSNSDWTRSEDKTILQVLKKETESEETFTKIMELLPNRTLAEVKARFFHVMDLLQQMALGEVT